MMCQIWLIRRVEHMYSAKRRAAAIVLDETCWPLVKSKPHPSKSLYQLKVTIKSKVINKHIDVVINAAKFIYKAFLAWFNIHIAQIRVNSSPAGCSNWVALVRIKVFTVSSILLKIGLRLTDSHTRQLV